MTMGLSVGCKPWPPISWCYWLYDWTRGTHHLHLFKGNLQCTMNFGPIGTSFVSQRPMTVPWSAITAGKFPTPRAVQGDCEAVYTPGRLTMVNVFLENGRIVQDTRNWADTEHICIAYNKYTFMLIVCGNKILASLVRGHWGVSIK